MAKMTIRATGEFVGMLNRLGNDFEEIAKEAVFEGTNIVANAIRQNIENLPEEEHRKLKPGERYSGISPESKKDLLRTLGVAPMRNENGAINTKIGFSGYTSKPTKQYSKGSPIVFVAMATESGSSRRVPLPFIRRAVNAKRKEAQEKMNKVVNDEIKKRVEKGV